MGHATAHTVHPRGPPRAGLCMTRLAIIRHRRTARTVYRHACTSAMALQRRRGTQQCRQAAHTPGARHASRNKGALAPQNGFRANCKARPAHTVQIRATCSDATLFPPKTFFARPVMATAPWPRRRTGFACVSWRFWLDLIPLPTTSACVRTTHGSRHRFF